MSHVNPRFDDIIRPRDDGGGIASDTARPPATTATATATRPLPVSSTLATSRRELREQLASLDAERLSAAPWWQTVSHTQWIGSVGAGLSLSVGVFVMILLMLPGTPAPPLYEPQSSTQPGVAGQTSAVPPEPSGMVSTPLPTPAPAPAP